MHISLRGIFYADFTSHFMLNLLKSPSIWQSYDQNIFWCFLIKWDNLTSGNSVRIWSSFQKNVC